MPKSDRKILDPSHGEASDPHGNISRHHSSKGIEKAKVGEVHDFSMPPVANYPIREVNAAINKTAPPQIQSLCNLVAQDDVSVALRVRQLDHIEKTQYSTDQVPVIEPCCR